MRFTESFYQVLESLSVKLKEKDDDYSKGIRLILKKIFEFINFIKNPNENEEEILSTIIEILDDIDIFTGHLSNESQKIKDSLRIINNHILILKRELLVILRNYGIREIPTKIGDDFDIQKHKAVGITFNIIYIRDVIIKIIRTGYERIKGFVLRFVEVIIGRFK